MYCRKCGKENLEGAKFCADYSTRTSEISTKKYSTWNILLPVIAMLCLVLILLCGKFDFVTDIDPFYDYSFNLFDSMGIGVY